MFKKVLVLGAVMLLASSVSAVDVPIGDGTGDIVMNLDIAQFAQVCIGTDGTGALLDEVIDFSSAVAGEAGSDYYRAFAGGVRGLYSPLVSGDKATTDAFATGYYESFDGADYWMQTNGGSMTMTINATGGLTNGTKVLPTWFTLCAGNFTLDGNWLTGGNIPIGGDGSYFADEVSPFGVMELVGTPAYSDQYNFDIFSGGTWNYTFEGVCNGSLKFLGRVLRDGFADPAGHYTTTMTALFTTP